MAEQDVAGVQLWSKDKLLQELTELQAVADDFTLPLGPALANLFKTWTSPAISHRHDAESKAWLDWCLKENKRVKVVAHDVPSGILPQRMRGCLYDMKVSVRGPDDAAYNKYQDLRQKVARGNSVLRLQQPDTGSVSHDGLVFALRKFTGGMGDEDEVQPDDNYVWLKYFLKPIDQAKQVVCTRKANGEAAHLAVRHLPECGFILCVGSKNVHMIVRNRSHLELYQDGRFQVAKIVGSAVVDLVLAMQPDKLTLFLNLMHWTRLTAVFELMQPHYQHVEDLSYLGDQCQLNLITFTTPISAEGASANHEVTSHCALRPDLGIELARNMGLQAVDYEVIQVDQVDAKMDQIRSSYGYEGQVLYFVDSDDNVIGMVKKKTVWYVLARAIREKVTSAMAKKSRSTAAFNLAQEANKIDTRMRQIQTWLGFPDDVLAAWVSLGRGFLSYVVDRNEAIRGRFPVVWKQYLASKQITDDVMKSAAQ